eukprot:3089615-Prymnesium_polylepis.1
MRLPDSRCVARRHKCVSTSGRRDGRVGSGSRDCAWGVQLYGGWRISQAQGTVGVRGRVAAQGSGRCVVSRSHGDVVQP